MITVSRPRIDHIALTVTNLEASVRWYGDVFGVSPVLDVPHQGGIGRILADEESTLVFALHAHDTDPGGAFTETRTGLDHVGLALPTRADLDAWQEHLERHGVRRAAAADRPLTQSPVAEEDYACVLVFRDPDNIQLELFCPPEA